MQTLRRLANVFHLLIYLFVQLLIYPLAEAQEPAVSSGSIVISEVMWMGSDLSTADEWVELAALSDQSGNAASLSGWTLVSVKDGSEQILVRFSSGASIAPGGFAVVSNYPDSQSRLAVAPLATSTSLSLPNTKLLLRLYDDLHVLRDEVDDGIGNPFAGINTSAQKASMERIDVHAPGTLASNWKSATQSVGFDAVPFTLFGSPGSGPLLSSSSFSSFASVSSSLSLFSTSSFSSSSDASAASSSSSSVAGPPAIVINEVMPNPVGSDDGEWLELLNVGSGSASTLGLSLSMSGGTLRSLPELELSPGIPLLIPKETSQLSLTNAGGTVMLRQGDQVLDAFAYPSVPEGISFGRYGGMARSLCMPTPGVANSGSGSVVAIDIQSGMPSGDTVTLNLTLRPVSGSIEGGTCRWEYPDGYVNESCNPPTHSVQSFGAGDVHLYYTDYCGNTMQQSLPVFVARKPKKIVEESDNSILPFSCMPSAFTGALITEVFPNPEGDEEEGESIEVRNVSGRDLPLCGWSLEDVSGIRFDLSKLRIPLDEFMVFPRTKTKIALNNDKETLRLLAPDPVGGSGTVLQEVVIKSAPSNQSFSLRDDGHWLWSTLPTPGTNNAFPVVPLPTSPPKARLAGILPNPNGADGGGEWVEIQNLTGRPLWPQGWILRSGKDVSLSGRAIHPYETLRIMASDLGLTLRNATGALQLFDEDGVEIDMLAWSNPGEGDVISHIRTKQVVEPATVGLTQSGTFAVTVGAETIDDLYPFGIRKSENINCNDLILTLMKNKKLELIFDTNMRESTLFFGGYDIAPFLLKNGCAFASHAVDLGYAVHEAEAIRYKRGLWAFETATAMARSIQEQEELLRIVRKEGLRIVPSIAAGLVESGAVLRFETNLPASVHVSVNDSHYQETTAGSLIVSDTVIQAYAEMRIGSGIVIRSDTVESEYVLRRDRYDVQQLLSEVYPSPKKGEGEWIELYNGSPHGINLAGWMIDDVADAGSKPFVFTTKHSILAGSTLVVRGTKVAWNNGGDDVRLIAPDGTVVDSVSFPKTKTGLSYARSTDGWCLTEKPTLSSGNICVIAPLKKKLRNSRSALIKNKKSLSEARKILYKNIVQIGESYGSLDSLYASLWQDSRLHMTSSNVSNGLLFVLLLVYVGLIRCLRGLWRY